MISFFSSAFSSMASRPYLTLALAGVMSAILYMSISFANKLIDGYIEQGAMTERAFWQAKQIRQQEEQQKLIDAANKKSRDTITTERGLAELAQANAAKRIANLIDDIGDLQNAKDTECVRVSADTVRLLNQSAIGYNSDRKAGS